jgi:hypothetical protein
MRDLYQFELTSVTGGSSSPSGPCHCPPTTPEKTKKGNNGFGNGSDAPNLAAPGGSGSTPGDKDGSLVR